MKFTLSWLKDYLETDCELQEITEKLTDIGLEVEKVTKDKAEFIISQIIEVKKHTDADSLNICMVNNGEEVLQIVCGANNVKEGMNVVLAKVGSTIPSNGMIITKSKIRGITSYGMLCSAVELGIGSDSEGILHLTNEAIIGESFFTIDPVIEIAITPNRGDCLGVYGIARDLAASGIGKLKSFTVPDINFIAKASPINVKINNMKSCSCFIGCYVKGVKNSVSPDWMQKRLQVIGLEPVSSLVDITNYLNFTFNRPMHVYDADKLSGDLIVKSAASGETFKALNGKSYCLDENVTVITDKKEIQAIAGVIGSMESSCTSDTENILLELALFNPISVGISSRKLVITTDASYRFERGLDDDFVLSGAKIAIDMIMSICGGEPYELVISEKVSKKKNLIPFNLHNLEKIAGFSIDKKKSEKFLENLGFAFQGNNLLVPSWRNDINGEADIVEEILRINGYGNIPLNPFSKLSQAQASNRSNLALNRNLLTMRGMYEVITWSFMDSKKVTSNQTRNNLIEIKNPIAKNFNVMRPCIVHNLIDVMQNNFSRDEVGIAIFEIGMIYSRSNSEELITGLRSGFNGKKNIYGSNREYDFFDVKADVLAILQQYNIENPQLTRNTPEYYHPGRSGCFMLGKTVISYFGELLERKKHRITIFEIFIERIPKIKRKRRQNNFSIYQSVNRDFGFVVKDDVSVGEMISVIKTSDKSVIQEIDVFDIHKSNEELGEGKKSVAVSVKLQALDKTLSGTDIEKVHAKIIKNIENKLGGILRRDYRL
ncbi:MAG: phenylalanine--tRNA ligase subunit beta [Rickettsiaceae bacterium H1]|nr:phenylalanine--tRNA ligase subunit beta [Rickettsiaceae bacterium H1]